MTRAFNDSDASAFSRRAPGTRRSARNRFSLQAKLALVALVSLLFGLASASVHSHGAASARGSSGSEPPAIVGETSLELGPAGGHRSAPGGSAVLAPASDACALCSLLSGVALVFVLLSLRRIEPRSGAPETAASLAYALRAWVHPPGRAPPALSFS